MDQEHELPVVPKRKQMKNDLTYDRVLLEIQYTKRRLALYEGSLVLRLEITRLLSEFLIAESKCKGKFIHLLELVHRIGISSDFHQTERTKCLQILKTTSLRILEFDKQMALTFSPLNAKVDLCVKYMNLLIEINENYEANLISLMDMDLESKIPYLICCQLDLPVGFHHCGDVNNNEEPIDFVLEIANHWLSEDWKNEMIAIAGLFKDFEKQFSFTCSLYAIKDDWEEPNDFPLKKRKNNFI